MIRHFGVPGQIQFGDLRSFIWKPDDTTGILIEMIERWRGDLVEKRPAIIIKQNTTTNLRLAIGDKVVGIDERGMERFSTFWIGSHTLFCIHGSGAGAKILAAEVSRELCQFSQVLLRELSLLKRWAVMERGAVAEIEEARESFVVPVTVAWAYEESWTLNLESLKLRKVPLQIRIGGAVFSETR